MIEQFLIYLIKVVIGSCIMYLCYHIFFRNDTFYGRNRLILILSILLPVIIPTINFAKLFAVSSEGTGYVVEAGSFVATTYYVENVISSTIQKISIIDIVFYIYLAGLILSLIRITGGVAKIHGIIRTGGTGNINGNLITITDKYFPPFSFYRNIIIPKELYENGEYSSIIEHECAHIKQRHYLDLLLSELFLAFLWFNPVAWLIRKSIKENHEYLADDEVAGKIRDVKNYQLSLLNVGENGIELPLANNFNKRIITKRIFMMNRNKTGPSAMTKNIIVIPTIIFLLFTITATSYTIVTQKKDSSPFSEVSQAGILEYIQRNITYPRTAALANVQGEIYVELRISKGEIQRLEIFTSPDDIKSPIIDDVVINALVPDEDALTVEKSTEEYLMQLKNEGKRIGEQLINLDVAEWNNRSIEFAIKLDFRLTRNIASIVNTRHASGSNNLSSFDIEKIKEGEKPLYILNGKIVSINEFKKYHYSDNIAFSGSGRSENPIYGEKSKDGFSILITKDAIDNRLLKDYLTEIDRRNENPLFATFGRFLSREELKDYDIEHTKILLTLKGKDATDLFGDKGKNGVVLLGGVRPLKK